MYDPKSILTLLIIALSCIGCAKENKVSNRSGSGGVAISGHEGIILEDQGLELTGTQMKGSGSFVFLQGLKNISSEQTFSMLLSIEEGGFADFRSYGYRELKGGLSARFTKIQGQYSIEFGNGTWWEEPVILPVDHSLPLDVTIDVNNTVTPSTITVYTGPLPIRRQDNRLFESVPDVANPLHGFGTYYGFVLASGTLESFVVKH